MLTGPPPKEVAAWDILLPFSSSFLGHSPSSHLRPFPNQGSWLAGPDLAGVEVSGRGYARIVFAIVSFYFMPCCPLTASSFYLLSGLLDAFDGHAARALNQGTRFGAMLDMLTDRCSTMCLLVNLALLYPRATLLFQLSMSLDVASHWLHLHSSVVRGSESHKMIDLSGNPVLRIYYTSRPALFTLCAGNELFYCLLYLFNFSEGPLVGSVGLFRVGLWVTAPIAVLKSLISVVHLITAARNMAALDAADRARKK
uniref:CDP-diacylglycerol--inositol 3-phosphatidyltransferase n=5 Tax=Felidae TaxID=9681 RepID=A0ABI7ZMY1_FELCA